MHRFASSIGTTADNTTLRHIYACKNLYRMNSWTDRHTNYGRNLQPMQGKLLRCFNNISSLACFLISYVRKG